MERIYRLLLEAGYPGQGVDWLRRQRLATIVALAVAAWLLFIGLAMLIWSIFSRLFV